jgi:hypothetical protein
MPEYPLLGHDIVLKLLDCLSNLPGVLGFTTIRFFLPCHRFLASFLQSSAIILSYFILSKGSFKNLKKKTKKERRRDLLAEPTSLMR